MLQENDLSYEHVDSKLKVDDDLLEILWKVAGP
jgi:hypothetical protein